MIIFFLFHKLILSRNVTENIKVDPFFMTYDRKKEQLFTLNIYIFYPTGF